MKTPPADIFDWVERNHPAAAVNGRWGCHLIDSELELTQLRSEIPKGQLVSIKKQTYWFWLSK